MDCIECYAVLEFIKYIPEILHLLKSQNQNEMYIMNGLSSFLEIWSFGLDCFWTTSFIPWIY